MSIVRYDPFRELRVLQDEMNRLFSGSMMRRGDDEPVARGAWMPQVDIIENQNEIVLEAELPGMNPENVELTIENNTLTLRGERKFEKKSESDNVHRIERSYGSFVRSFTLPPTVSASDANAEYRDGVLRVTLKKREETKATRIEVKGGSGTPKTIDTKAESATDGKQHKIAKDAAQAAK